MHIISIVFFAICASSDNFIVGISYGINKIRIDIFNNIVIAFIAGLGTFISMLFGSIFLKFMTVRTANIVGSFTLIGLGIYLLIAYVVKSKKESHKNNYDVILDNPQVMDINNSKVIEFKEALFLGFILSINNIGLGIAASITGLNIYFTSIFSVLFGIVFIRLGSYVGRKLLSDKLAKYSEIFSYLLIIFLGVYELLM